LLQKPASAFSLPNAEYTKNSFNKGPEFQASHQSPRQHLEHFKLSLDYPILKDIVRKWL